MRSEWRTVSVGDLGRIVTGKTPKTAIAENYGGDIPFLTPSDDMGVKVSTTTAKTLTERGLSEVKNCLLPPHSICVSCIGSDLGKVVMTSRATVTNQQINSIVPSSDFDAEFVYYAMCILGKELNYISKTSTAVPIVNKSSFSSYQIDVPSLPEQQKIGRVLSALDARIAGNRTINHHLEQMARAIFKSWFVDFEPWGGEMPENWREGTLSEVANVTMGQSPDGSSYNEDGIGMVFYQGRAEFGFRFPTRRLFTTQPKRIATKGDVLMSVRAPVGDINVAFEPCCLGRGLVGIQSNNGCQSFVLYTMFALKQTLDMFNGEGTVFGSINKNDMANLPVLIPADDVLHQFEELINPIDTAIEKNHEESCNLQVIRDVLLPRLMSGELSVKDIDIA